MKLRRITSLTALLSFILMVLTSVILYIMPHGRVAYWADWHMWGLTKDDWGGLHINLGVLFLVASLVHLYLNWQPIMTYMKNRAREFRMFTPEFNVALVLTIVFSIGTLAGVPPFSSILDFGESLKTEAGKQYGEPPYGHAELSSLTLFAKRMGIDLDKGLARLEKKGISVNAPTMTVKEVAVANGISPQDVYMTMKPAEGERKAMSALPPSPPAGFGNRTLGDICAELKVDPADLIRKLGEEGITAEAGRTVKETAGANGRSPMDVYEVLKGIVNGK